MIQNVSGMFENNNLIIAACDTKKPRGIARSFTK